MSENLSPTIPNDSTINATPLTDMPSEQLDNETSSTKCPPTSSHSTTTGSKSIDASDSKFNSQEMKSKSLQSYITVIYRLKPEGD